MSEAREFSGLTDVLQKLMASLPPSLAKALQAAAVPHHFDAKLLSTLLGLEETEEEKLYAGLQKMPFVRPVGQEGSVLHESIRDLLLNELWEKSREDYRAYSRLAAEYFQSQEGYAAQLEALYHWLVAEPDRGADLARDWGAEWNNSFQYEHIETLVQLGLEHDRAGRLKSRARGWVYFWKGQTHIRYSENREAMIALREALDAACTDQQLEINCISALGDVHRRLDEYEEARGRYEQALPSYRAIADRLGEANCIMLLGHVHLRLDEYEEARGRYEGALAIYRAIADRLGEANCIMLLGHVHLRLDEYEEARERYEGALPIYRAIGTRLGEANCIQSLGNVHRMLAEYEEARERYEGTLAIYRAIGDRLGEANCISALGDVHLSLDEYEEARGRYEGALAIYQTIGDHHGQAATHVALGLAYEAQGNRDAARQHLTAALALYEAIGLPYVEVVRKALEDLA